MDTGTTLVIVLIVIMVIILIILIGGVTRGYLPDEFKKEKPPTFNGEMNKS